MKIQLLLFICFFQTLAFSQTHLDNQVSIRFPGKTDTLQQNSKGVSLKAFYHNTTDDSFVVMKIEGIPEPFTLAKNQSDLESFYRTISGDMVKSMAKKNLVKSSEKLIKFKNYFTYKIDFSDKLVKKKNGECMILFVNQIAYFFIYSKVDKYSEARKNSFFSSIVVQENLAQIEPEYDYHSDIMKILKDGLFLILIIILLRMAKKRKASS